MNPTPLPTEALETFRRLLREASESGDPEPTAMTLATVDAHARPTVRTVLLKGVDELGFVFYTNYESRKGHELAGNPNAALLFFWKSLRHQVQVRIEGPAARLTPVESDRYFASRPRMSQLGAWASLQSQTLDRRETFENRLADYEREFAGGDVPRPPHWGGYRLSPTRIEFWYGAEFRLHERHLHEHGPDGWTTRMLYP
ncbi:MAG TPA: pyridoxamine 5'-phosphate oxidase [Xanthomonadales bacterium]|nr:pyridoxamine 5'-phosphate oxidase [Xanthomonadales bacterium]